MTTESQADRLIQELAAGGRPASQAELLLIGEHIAAAEFDPAATSKVGGRVAGLEWRGRTLGGSDRLPSAEVHYLRHVVRGQEWPAGTSLQTYLETIRNTIQDSRSGVFLSEYQARLQVGFIHRTGANRGTKGQDWILVEYRGDIGYLVTAHQIPWHLLLGPERRMVRWLKQPE